MKTYQIFDYEGGDHGIVTTELGMADAARKARAIWPFPILVEMTKDQSVTVQELVDRKTQFECWLAGVIEEQIVKFEEAMHVRVKAVNTYVTQDDSGFRHIHVDLHPDINVVGE